MKLAYALLAALLLMLVAGCGAGTGPVAQSTATPLPTAVPALPTAAPSPTVPPVEPTAAEPAAAATGTVTASLTLEEYPVVADSVDKPTHFEFKDRIPPATFEKRRAWREPSFEQQAGRANAVLAPFGYRLAATPEANGRPAGYELYKDEQLVLADIAYFHWPQVSADGKDLAMVAEQMTGSPYLVGPAGGQPWDPSQHVGIAPVFVGQKLVDVVTANMTKFDVLVGDEVAYTAGPFQPGPETPVKGLAAWDGHWVLEVEGQAVVDGKSLNQELGYDEIFDWATVNGQSFYFFGKEGRVGVSYAGQVLPVQYDAVAHYQCCEAGMFNPQSNQDMVWFYGLRDGTWYYVEMGFYR